MRWAVDPCKHQSCTNSMQDFSHSMQDVHAALTWQQGWLLGVGTLPVQLDAFSILLLPLFPGGLNPYLVA